MFDQILYRSPYYGTKNIQLLSNLLFVRSGLLTNQQTIITRLGEPFKLIVPRLTSIRFKLLMLKIRQFWTNFFPLFLELTNHYKHVLNSPRYISSFQTLSPYRSQQVIVIVRSQSFSRFRVIITLFEMINEPRLKTGPYVTCFLFFLYSKSTLRWLALWTDFIII